MTEQLEYQDYKYTLDIPTRWADNDQYQHVNNVTYYSYFDTIVNYFLLEKGFLSEDLPSSKVKGLVVETQCQYHAPISFPDMINVALCVVRIGSSSVKYQIGIFSKGKLCAHGHFVHVYVDENNKPKPLDDDFRACLEEIKV